MSPCPSCKKHSLCGCVSCMINFAGEYRRRYDPDTQKEVCPHCLQGFSCDAWLDAEVSEMKDNGTWNITEDENKDDFLKLIKKTSNDSDRIE